MIATIRKCIAMMPEGLAWRWWVLAPLTLITSAAEAVTALAVLAIFQVLNDPSQVHNIGWLSWIVQRLPNQDPNAIVLQLMALAAVYHVAKTVLAIVASYTRHRIMHDAAAALATRLLKRYLAAPYPFHFHRHSSALIRNCTTSVGEVMGVTLGTGVAAVSEATMAAGIAVVLFQAAPGLAVAAGTVLAVILILALRLTRRAAARHGEQGHAQLALMLQTLHQAFGGIKEIKVLGREPYFFNEFDGRQRQALLLGYHGITLSFLPAAVIQTMMVVGGLGIVAVLTVTNGAGPQILPTVGLFGYAALRLMPTATWLLNAINSLRAARPAVDELYADFQALEEPQPETASPIVDFDHVIHVENVTYQYPAAAAPALVGVDLTIRRGESVGIVGPTGAGKSTLVDLVLGLLPPTTGRVTVDGVDIGPRGARWHRLVGYVPQSLFLIDDSLRRNIALGVPDREIDNARVAEVVAMAQLDDVIRRLPNGLETHPGERGLRLSGGERQRIAIARALYHDPDILVFDEATSSLDLATEAEVSRTIERLRGNKTMLVVAHRLSTVRRCDRIVFLQQGRVAGVGSFDELQARNDQFRALTALATLQA